MTDYLMKLSPKWMLCRTCKPSAILLPWFWFENKNNSLVENRASRQRFNWLSFEGSKSGAKKKPFIEHVGVHVGIWKASITNFNNLYRVSKSRRIPFFPSTWKSISQELQQRVTNISKGNLFGPPAQFCWPLRAKTAAYYCFIAWMHRMVSSLSAASP